MAKIILERSWDWWGATLEDSAKGHHGMVPLADVVAALLDLLDLAVSYDTETQTVALEDHKTSDEGE